MVRRAVSYAGAFAAAMLVAAVFSYSFAAPAGDSEYVGSAKCKSCHEKWKQYSKWSESKHAKAFEALASDEAKKIAKEKGIADPQKDDKCLKCHVTALGEKDVAKSFDQKMGVQCEACNGPAGAHVDADDQSTEKPGPKPTEETCKKCHNSESPTFKAFDFKTMNEKIAHPKKK